MDWRSTFDPEIYKTKVLTSGIVKRIFTKRNLIDCRKFKLIFRENQGLDCRETFKLSKTFFVHFFPKHLIVGWGGEGGVLGPEDGLSRDEENTPPLNID